MSKFAKRMIEQWLSDARLTPDETIESVMRRVADQYRTPTMIARQIGVYDNAVRTFYTRRAWEYDKDRQQWVSPTERKEGAA